MSPIRVDDGGPAVVIAATAPILSRERMAALAAALGALGADPRPVVLASSHPTIFLAGADLAEIAALDASTAGPYAADGRAVLERIRTHPSPVVAAVHGPCTGGGLDLALACDAIVAGPESRFSHPGVRRGLVTGWAGTARLRPTVERARATAALVAAHELTSADLGTVVLEVPDHDELAAKAVSTAVLLDRVDRRRLLLWRQLRAGCSIDSLRASVVLTKMVAADASSLEAQRRDRG